MKYYSPSMGFASMGTKALECNLAATTLSLLVGVRDTHNGGGDLRGEQDVP